MCGEELGVWPVAAAPDREPRLPFLEQQGLRSMGLTSSTYETACTSCLPRHVHLTPEVTSGQELTAWSHPILPSCDVAAGVRTRAVGQSWGRGLHPQHSVLDSTFCPAKVPEAPATGVKAKVRRERRVCGNFATRLTIEYDRTFYHQLVQKSLPLRTQKPRSRFTCAGGDNADAFCDLTGSAPSRGQGTSSTLLPGRATSAGFRVLP